MRYATIVADPPWIQPSGGPANGNGFAVKGGRPSTLPYGTLTTNAIRELPVSEMADTHAHLYLWTTNAHIEDAYAIARAWHFSPSVLLTWAKTPHGEGLGGTFVQTTEHVLFARRGRLTAKRRIDRSCFD